MREKYFIRYSMSGKTVGVLYDHHCNRVVVGCGVGSASIAISILHSMGISSAPSVSPSRSRIRWEAPVERDIFSGSIGALINAGVIVVKTRSMGRLMR